METIWQEIKTNVTERNWYSGEDAFGECFQSLTNCNSGLLKAPLEPLRGHTYIVPRNGDIVVGLYLHDDIQEELDVNVMIGGVDVGNLHLVPGNVTYLLENTHCLPLIAICYSEVHIRSESNNLQHVSVIYAIIGHVQLRQKLATSTSVLHLKEKDAIVRGCFGFIDDLDEYLQECPDYNNSYITCPNIAELSR